MEPNDATIINVENKESEASIVSSTTPTLTPSHPIPSSHPIRRTSFSSSEDPAPLPPTMSSSDIKIHGYNPVSNLPILKKGNFNKWTAKITTALYAARLGHFILSDQSPPSDTTKLDEYTTRSYQALFITQTSVDSEHFQLVANATTPREAFLAILAQYNDSGGLPTAVIFSELVSLRLEGEGDLSEHTHWFRTLQN